MLGLEFSRDAYRERPHTVFSLWVAGVPLVLHLFSGASPGQLSGSAVYLSVAVLFFGAYSGSYFLERVDDRTPLAFILVIAISLALIKIGVQAVFGDTSLLEPTLGVEAAASTAVVAVLMAYGLKLDK